MRFITMMGTAALSMTAATLAQSTTINEIRTGSGNAEYIEIKGAPGASMAGLALVVLGDGTSTGTVTKTGLRLLLPLSLADRPFGCRSGGSEELISSQGDRILFSYPFPFALKASFFSYERFP